MTRGARIALVLAGLGMLCTLGLCAGGAVLAPQLGELAGCPASAAPHVSGVQDDPRRVREFLPLLASPEQPVSAHWRWREARPHTCPEIGPMDFIYEGFAVLAPERAGALRSSYTWNMTTAPEVPADLAPYGPRAPAWERSADLDAAARAQVWLDLGSATAYFVYVRG